MNTLWRSLFGAFAFLVGGVDVAVGQEVRVATERLFASRDTVRMNAFYSLVRAAGEHGRRANEPPTASLAAQAKQQPELADALIRLLQREDEVIQNAAHGSLSPDYLGIYYTDLVVTVARMQDRRSVRALIPGVATSDVVRSTLAGFGDDAVGPLVAAFGADDRDVRAGAILTANRMLRTQLQTRLSDASIAVLRDALLRIAQSGNDAFVRVSAIDALRPFDGADLRRLMEHIAATDTVTGYAPPGRPRPLPVRVAAEHWLQAHP